jgi:UDP:flavonoid glycosyltransferase YjiC (YdhE family)
MDEFPDGVVLVAFGTTWVPNQDMIDRLIKVFKAMPNKGFIIGLKRLERINQIKAAGLKNTLIKEFIPQKQLLNDTRILIFISHGGGNSVTEALYYGKPLVVFPVAIDQFGSSYRVEEHGFGLTMGLNTDPDFIVHAIE